MVNLCVCGPRIKPSCRPKQLFEKISYLIKTDTDGIEQA